MPLYSYTCGDCGAEAELLMRSDDVAICPACGSAKMERLPSWIAPDLKSDKIRKSWRETCELNKKHPDAATLFNPNKLPAFHDPFAGGGAIPLEA